MNYEKLLEEFIKEVKEEGTYASQEELREVVIKMLEIIRDNKDATPEELVEKVIEENVEQLEEIKNKYPIPGYTVGVSTDNINVKIYGGDIDSEGRKMPSDALFDIASMTKFYTQIVAYNLIKEGVFSFDDKIRDLDPRFVNVGDLTVRDVLTFTTKFQTNGRLSDKATVAEALDCLYKMQVAGVGEYNYNDMGMMLMKEVMEKVTGMSYQQLVDKYIISKLGLHDTHLIVPSDKIDRLTGSANDRLGAVNDPSALSVGGFSGHAGMRTTSDDSTKLGKGVVDGTVLPTDMLSDTYTHGVNDIRGIMGNTYTPHEKGVDASYVDRLEPLNTFAIQGSTRTQMNVGEHAVSTIFLNPACMSLSDARAAENRINEARMAKGQTPLSLVKHFVFERDGKQVEYDLIDARQMAPSGRTVEPITTSNAKLALRLRFLSKVIEAYDKNYDKEINVTVAK